ncbi:helix-turn-helix domain-containing protein [Sinorhizobium meliloti]|uniref:helix-turn-helix domain-containing protein n=1 Tax=Rhizobium meliloti TaxID=382 RepID=UPI001F2C7E87|nr:helix-turn-helix domain-containing protein [Sinorhizobium meliloti]
MKHIRNTPFPFRPFALHISSEQVPDCRKLTYLFSREGGVASYIQKRRLHLARQCLRDQRHAHKSIADIGLEHGFLYAPNFTRAFQQTYGMTPRETRAMARRTWLAGERESPSWFYRASRWGL